MSKNGQFIKSAQPLHRALSPFPLIGWHMPNIICSRIGTRKITLDDMFHTLYGKITSSDARDLARPGQ